MRAILERVSQPPEVAGAGRPTRPVPAGPSSMSRRPVSDPGQARIVSIAALALGDDGNVETEPLQPARTRCRPRAHACARADRRDAGGPADVRRHRSATWSSCCAGARWSPTTSASTTRSWPPRPSWSGPNCPSTPSCAPSSWLVGSTSARRTCGWRRSPALGHHPDEAPRRARRRTGARPDPQARAGAGPRAQGVAAGAIR